MRLIDADELKKAIHSYENRKLPLDTVIDNAPTVETTIEHFIDLKKVKEIEDYAKKEVFDRLLAIVNDNQFPEYVEDELINYLREEGFKI